MVNSYWVYGSSPSITIFGSADFFSDRSTPSAYLEQIPQSAFSFYEQSETLLWLVLDNIVLDHLVALARHRRRPNQSDRVRSDVVYLDVRRGVWYS